MATARLFVIMVEIAAEDKEMDVIGMGLMEQAGDTIRRRRMLEAGDHVILGLSGGADSVALFHALRLLSGAIKLRLTAVHINHGIRGDEARRDEDFVKALCEAYGIACEVIRADVPGYAKDSGMTLEEAGRVKRYDAFYEALRRHEAQKIAVAHHKNDQAETLLMRMIRGTGPMGLAGIPPVNGAVIRPLIDCAREEIEMFLSENNWDYMMDSSNLAPSYTRNQIRLAIMPRLLTINPRSVDALARLAEMAAEENAYLDAKAEEAYHNCRGAGKETELFIPCLKSYPLVLQRRIIRMACLLVAESMKDISYEHIRDILMLMQKGTGKALQLPARLTVSIEYDKLVFRKDAQNIVIGKEYILKAGGLWNGECQYQSQKIQETGQTVTVSAQNIKELASLHHCCTAQWDYDKIKGNIRVRGRRNGDRIMLPGGGTKKVKDILIDAKVPRDKREQVLIISDDSDILWIVGHRDSIRHRPDETTKRSVYIQIWEDII